MNPEINTALRSHQWSALRTSRIVKRFFGDLQQGRQSISTQVGERKEVIVNLIVSVLWVAEVRSANPQVRANPARLLLIKRGGINNEADQHQGLSQ